MSSSLLLRNRHRGRRVDGRFLRRIIRSALEQDLGREDSELGIILVGNAEMTRINETYLRHAGTTDVITFDYGEVAQPGRLRGDIFVCVSEAEVQAGRFRTTWQQELVRYVIHGILHLCGHDDATAPARRRMKAAENRLVRAVAGRFDLRKLGSARAGKGGA